MSDINEYCSIRLNDSYNVFHDHFQVFEWDHQSSYSSASLEVNTCWMKAGPKGALWRERTAMRIYQTASSPWSSESCIWLFAELSADVRNWCASQCNGNEVPRRRAWVTPFRSNIVPNDSTQHWRYLDIWEETRSSYAMIRPRSFAKGGIVRKIGLHLLVPGRQPRGRPNPTLAGTL